MFWFSEIIEIFQRNVFTIHIKFSEKSYGFSKILQRNALVNRDLGIFQRNAFLIYKYYWNFKEEVWFIKIISVSLRYCLELRCNLLKTECMDISWNYSIIYYYKFVFAKSWWKHPASCKNNHPILISWRKKICPDLRLFNIDWSRFLFQSYNINLREPRSLFIILWPVIYAECFTQFK